MPESSAVVVASGVAAAWLPDLWDRFGHLAITSAEKRCGKTRLLQLLELITPEPRNTSNISPAAVWRLIETSRPTLMIDEAQSLTRRGSESTEVIREVLCASIDKNAKVLRVSGPNHDVREFSVYCPKVIALIGLPDPVLADRCIIVQLRRKTAADPVEPFRSRVVGPLGAAVAEKLKTWAEANRDRIAAVHDGLEPFPIANDRMAEILLPLQAVAEADGGGHVETLRRFAGELDRQDAEAERMSPGVRLLAECREIFANVKPSPLAPRDGRFLSTDSLIGRLSDRSEEPWRAFVRGTPITPEALATLLRPYGIKSLRNARQTARGYTAELFADAWTRYLPSETQS